MPKTKKRSRKKPSNDLPRDLHIIEADGASESTILDIAEAKVQLAEEASALLTSIETADGE